jgi:hypothetical protein
MSKRTKIQRFFSGTGILLLILMLGYLAVNPWLLRWDATNEEATRAMPGDLDHIGWTRGMTINATPEEIWPWLMQWGQGRGGWYSYDWLENLFGFDIHTADRILPEYQDLQIGDPICMARGFCTSHVTVLEPNQWLSWQAKDESSNPVWTFTFGIFPLDASHTRLIIRESFRSDAVPPAAVFILEIPDVVMEQKALHTVRNRAEDIRESALVTPLEFLVWFAALVTGAIAGLLFVNRGEWKLLLLGIVSVLVLLVLTFLFPPYWLRVLLDLSLLAGLVCLSDSLFHQHSFKLHLKCAQQHNTM